MSYHYSGGNSLTDNIKNVVENPWYKLIMSFMLVSLLIISIVLVVRVPKPIARFSQPPVGLLDQTAAGPDKTRLDAANQGVGTFDMPLGSPEYSDEATQIAAAQLEQAKAGFRSRFFNSRADGPNARYVPFMGANEVASTATKAAVAATGERMSNDDVLVQRMQGLR